MISCTESDRRERFFFDAVSFRHRFSHVLMPTGIRLRNGLSQSLIQVTRSHFQGANPMLRPKGIGFKALMASLLLATVAGVGGLARLSARNVGVACRS